MKKRLTLTLLGLTLTLTAAFQVTVTGTVIASDDKTPMPGVSIVEKGTMNGTSTGSDGQFSISVKDKEATLVFHFIGFVTTEVPLNGQDNINVTLKTDCIRDWFDVQQIGLFLNSGVVNNPVGGKLEIAFPAYFGQGTLTSSLSYQTDFEKNKFINGDVKLKHFIFNCDFDMDISWFHKKVDFEDYFNSVTNSLETNLTFNRLGIMAGYSHLNVRAIETGDRNTYHGPVIGIKSWIGGPLRLVISGKAAVYKDRQEYSGEILRASRYFDLFINFYRLDTFTELSLGIGGTFNYRFKRQKM